MRSAIVFVGPSLWPRPDPPAGIVLRGPAARGDILRAARARPRAIGLIDGAFETLPAVWHKEILFALAAGIPVLGAASLGALRAVEMAPFGMLGVGRVFRDFRVGRLEDDDDVAVQHAPAALGYRPLTLAMVDARAMLARVQDPGAAIERALKAVHYKDRTLERVRAICRRHGAPAELARDVERQFARQDRGVKRRDSLALLARLGDPLPRPEARFAATVFWRRALAGMSRPFDLAH